MQMLEGIAPSVVNLDARSSTDSLQPVLSIVGFHLVGDQDRAGRSAAIPFWRRPDVDRLGGPCTLGLSPGLAAASPSPVALGGGGRFSATGSVLRRNLCRRTLYLF